MNLPYLAVGIFVAAAYLLALYLQFSRKLYETTVFPLVMLVSGALNHALILLSRWSFLVEDYGAVPGMPCSSRLAWWEFC